MFVVIVFVAHAATISKLPHPKPRHLIQTYHSAHTVSNKGYHILHIQYKPTNLHVDNSNNNDNKGVLDSKGKERESTYS